MRWSVGCTGERNAAPTTRTHDAWVGRGAEDVSRGSRRRPQQISVPRHEGSHVRSARIPTGALRGLRSGYALVGGAIAAIVECSERGLPTPAGRVSWHCVIGHAPRMLRWSYGTNGREVMLGRRANRGARRTA